MLGLLTRLFRVFWRQENEGLQAGATILPFPVAEVAQATVVAAPPAPIEFIRRAGATIAPPAKPASRQLAARLQSVQRLNPPSSRAGRKPATAGKPKPAAAQPQKKSAAAVKPGIVLNRLAAHQRRSSAEIVSLTDVRRARQIEVADLEIAALFN